MKMPNRDKANRIDVTKGKKVVNADLQYKWTLYVNRYTMLQYSNYCKFSKKNPQIEITNFIESEIAKFKSKELNP
jgi:hypothetical protein